MCIEKSGTISLIWGKEIIANFIFGGGKTVRIVSFNFANIKGKFWFTSNKFAVLVGEKFRFWNSLLQSQFEFLFIFACWQYNNKKILIFEILKNTPISHSFIFSCSHLSHLFFQILFPNIAFKRYSMFSTFEFNPEKFICHLINVTGGIFNYSIKVPLFSHFKINIVNWRRQSTFNIVLPSKKDKCLQFKILEHNISSFVPSPQHISPRALLFYEQYNFFSHWPFHYTLPLVVFVHSQHDLMK